MQPSCTWLMMMPAAHMASDDECDNMRTRCEGDSVQCCIGLHDCAVTPSAHLEQQQGVGCHMLPSHSPASPASSSCIMQQQAHQ